MKSASQIHRLSSELDVIVGPIALRFSGFKEALPAAVRDTFTPWQRALADVAIIHRASISLGSRQRHFCPRGRAPSFGLGTRYEYMALGRLEQQIRKLTGFDGSTAPLEPCAKLLLRRSAVSFCTVQRLTLGERRGSCLAKAAVARARYSTSWEDTTLGTSTRIKLFYDNQVYTLPAESSNTHPSQVVPQAIKHCGYLMLGEKVACLAQESHQADAASQLSHQ